MKKAKIMLMAIAVFGVVGGALAFKAKSFQSHLFYSTGVNGLCTVPVNTTLTTTAAPFGTVQTTYYTTSVAAACPTTRVTAVN